MTKQNQSTTLTDNRIHSEELNFSKFLRLYHILSIFKFQSQLRAKNRSCCMRCNATGAGPACICRVPTHTDGLFHMHTTSALSWILEPVVSRPYAKPPHMPWFCQLKCQLSVKVWVTTRIRFTYRSNQCQCRHKTHYKSLSLGGSVTNHFKSRCRRASWP